MVTTKHIEQTITNAGMETLPVMEAFYTLQGEGFHQGKAAYFIRLAGCDVGCFWCDVKESWNSAIHPTKTIDQIIEQAIATKSLVEAANRNQIVPGVRQTPNICVITGGEPLMHDLTALTLLLQENGFQTHIETSGAYPLTGSWDWICVSPKKFKQPLKETLKQANELKVIIYNKADFNWAEESAACVSPGCQLYLQPEWSKCSIMTPYIIEYIKAHPEWQISLQIHKYIDIP